MAMRMDLNRLGFLGKMVSVKTPDCISWPKILLLKMNFGTQCLDLLLVEPKRLNIHL